MSSSRNTKAPIVAGPSGSSTEATKSRKTPVNPEHLQEKLNMIAVDLILQLEIIRKGETSPDERINQFLQMGKMIVSRTYQMFYTIS